MKTNGLSGKSGTEEMALGERKLYGILRAFRPFRAKMPAFWPAVLGLGFLILSAPLATAAGLTGKWKGIADIGSTSSANAVLRNTFELEFNSQGKVVSWKYFSPPSLTMSGYGTYSSTGSAVSMNLTRKYSDGSTSTFGIYDGSLKGDALGGTYICKLGGSASTEPQLWALVRDGASLKNPPQGDWVGYWDMVSSGKTYRWCLECNNDFQGKVSQWKLQFGNLWYTGEGTYSSSASGYSMHLVAKSSSMEEPYPSFTFSGAPSGLQILGPGGDGSWLGNGAWLMAYRGGGEVPTASPTPTASFTPSPTPVISPTTSPTPTLTASPSVTPSASASPTPSPSPTSSPSPSATASATAPPDLKGTWKGHVLLNGDEDSKIEFQFFLDGAGEVLSWFTNLRESSYTYWGDGEYSWGGGQFNMALKYKFSPDESILDSVTTYTATLEGSVLSGISGDNWPWTATYQHAAAPTPLPTPPPETEFSFEEHAEEWKFSDGIDSEGAYTAGRLGVRAAARGICYGTWSSPTFQIAGLPGMTKEGVMPIDGVVGENSLFRGVYSVGANAGNSAKSPQLRVGAFGVLYDQSEMMVISPVRNGKLSPGLQPREYVTYFSQPQTHLSFNLSFELLKVDDRSTTDSWFYLDGARVKGLRANQLSNWKNETSLDFAQSDHGWTFQSVEPYYKKPLHQITPKGLEIRGIESGTSTEIIYGYWDSTNSGLRIPLEAGRLYRSQFTVSSNARSVFTLPTFRLRVNDSTFCTSALMNLESNFNFFLPAKGDSVSFSVYYEPPPGLGDAELLVSFDYLFVPGGLFVPNDPTVALTLTSLKIDSCPVPAEWK